MSFLNRKAKIMKKSLLFFLTLAMLCSIMSCKKSDTSSGVVGAWSRSGFGYNATITFTNATDFSYSQTYSGTPYSTSGTYVITGNEIDITETSLYSGCRNVVGKYNFTVSGSQLTFSLISDACTTSRPIIVPGVWSK